MNIYLVVFKTGAAPASHAASYLQVEAENAQEAATHLREWLGWAQITEVHLLTNMVGEWE